MDRWLDGALAVLVAVLSALAVGGAWWAVRRGRERMRLLTDVRTALLGFDGLPQYGVAHEPGLVERVSRMEAALGRNGGSTVFDRLDAVTANQGRMVDNQQRMMAWQDVHTDEGNAVAEAMAEAGTALANVLEQAGLDYEPMDPPRFTSPRHAARPEDESGQ